jgi:hypothetical protein
METEGNKQKERYRGERQRTKDRRGEAERGREGTLRVEN